ncbi:unnamed protein product [Arctia plantaginis]|uniref:Uncharacterized protein n=1 Tax=Arctia plantaginis TaxID=874455 RepID=A0A8S0ZEB8_ARCPL|nr:unnamed protein product [Arctia plantaginis]
MCTPCVPCDYGCYTSGYRWGPYNYSPVMSSLFCPNPNPSWSFYGAGCPMSPNNTGYPACCPYCGYCGVMNNMSQSYNNVVADFPINTMCSHVFNQFNRFNPESFVKLPCLEEMFKDLQKTSTPLPKQVQPMSTIAPKVKCKVSKPQAVYRPKPQVNDPGTDFRLVTEGPRVLNPRLMKSRAPSKTKLFPTTDGRTTETLNSNSPIY